jgi:DNA replication and repair protein RecF
MRLRRLVLRNFRNLQNTEITPAEGLNLLVGPNASGKTNLCEAIYYAARGGLLKGERQRDLIRWDQTQAALDLLIQGDHVRIFLNGSAQSKVIEYNHQKVRQHELRPVLRALVFTPDELQTIKGSPDQRRSFMDKGASDLSLAYRHQLVEYEQVLKRKNLLLRREPVDKEQLAVANEELSRRGAFLIQKRLAYLNKLNAHLPALYERLCGKAGGLQLQYETAVKETSDLSKIQTELVQRMTQQIQREIQQGVAQLGPHRDDIKIQIDERDLRRFGSQGEQKSAMVALLLAQLELHYERYHDHPILLLDDVLSELDADRCRRLLEILPGEIQIFLTHTELTEELQRRAGRVYSIQDGRVTVCDASG